MRTDGGLKAHSAEHISTIQFKFYLLIQEVSDNICIKIEILCKNILPVSTPLLWLLRLQQVYSWGRFCSYFDQCKWPLHCALVSVGVVQISHIQADHLPFRIHISELVLWGTENLCSLPCLFQWSKKATKPFQKGVQLRVTKRSDLWKPEDQGWKGPF